MHLMIVVAHPDDEILNAGGTIIKHLKRSDQVSVVFMTYGEKGWPAPIFKTMQIREIRIREAQVVSEKIGFSKYFMKSSDTYIYYDRSLCIKLIKIIRSLKPDIIATHFFGERHPDHRNTSILTLDASYFASIAGICPKIKAHYISSEYMFASQGVQNTFIDVPSKIYIDVSEVFEEAIEALRGYKSQYRGYEAIMKERAAKLGSELGVKFVEAFMPIKMSQSVAQGICMKLFDSLPV